MLERVESAAQAAESGLSSGCSLERLDALVGDFQLELQRVKEEETLGRTIGEGAVAQLEQRLHACKRRLGIIRMSGEDKTPSENLYLKQRERGESDYYQRNSDNLKKYIRIASHSIHSIEQQKTLLKRGRKKLEDGLEYLGFSDRVVDQISNRYLTDYRIFQSLVVGFLLLFIYVVFLRRG